MGRITTRTALDTALERIRSSFSGSMALAAQNLRTGEMVEFDADVVFPTASTIKLAVLVEVFRQAHEGLLDLYERLTMRSEERIGGSGILKELGGGLQPTIYDLAMLMVVLSDNTATNMLVDRVGGLAPINETMQSRLGLSSVVLHNKVDFAAIGSDIRRFGEASSADLMRLTTGIVRSEVISAEASAAMLDIMERQQYLDQVPRYLNFNPYAKTLGLTQDIQVGCKTGFFTGTRVDAGVIKLPKATTIAYCVMSDGGRDASFNAENEGAVTAGLVGRFLLEYWWPSAWDDAVQTLPSPHVQTLRANLGA